MCHYYNLYSVSFFVAVLNEERNGFFRCLTAEDLDKHLRSHFLILVFYDLWVQKNFAACTIAMKIEHSFNFVTDLKV